MRANTRQSYRQNGELCQPTWKSSSFMGLSVDITFGVMSTGSKLCQRGLGRPVIKAVKRGMELGEGEFGWYRPVLTTVLPVSAGISWIYVGRQKGIMACPQSQPS